MTLTLTRYYLRLSFIKFNILHDREFSAIFLRKLHRFVLFNEGSIAPTPYCIGSSNTKRANERNLLNKIFFSFEKKFQAKRKKGKKKRIDRFGKNIIRENRPTVLHERRMQIYPMEADQIESIYTCTLHTSYPTSRTTRILINTFLNIPPLLLIASVKSSTRSKNTLYISKKYARYFRYLILDWWIAIIDC